MNTQAVKAILAIAALHLSAGLMFSPVAVASSVVPLDLNQISAGAEQIAHVRCIANESQADATIGIVTVSTFVVLDRVKGAASSTLTVRQAGGELNGLVIDYHTPRFRVGEEYVLFLPRASTLGLASPVGLAQGAFSVRPGRNGKEVGNGRDFAELLIGIDHAHVPPGMAGQVQQAAELRTRVDLHDFLTLMRAKAVAR